MSSDEKHIEQTWDDTPKQHNGTGAVRRGSVMVGNMIIENPLQVSASRPVTRARC